MLEYKFDKIGPEKYKIISVAAPYDLVGGVLSMELSSPESAKFRELEWLLANAQQKRPFEGGMGMNAHEILVTDEKLLFTEHEEYAGKESTCEIPLSEFVNLFEDWKKFLTSKCHP